MPAAEAYIGFVDEEGKPSPPLPKQAEASSLRAKHKYILNAGSFATGKTKWLCHNMVYDAHTHPGVTLLTGRKKLTWFRSTTLIDLLEAIPDELMIKHDQQQNNIYIKTADPKRPSLICYRPLDVSEESIKAIKSMNLAGAYFDQIEELSYEIIDAAAGRLRDKKGPRQILGAANPLGRNWVWKRWINGEGGPSYGFIEARMWRKGVPAPTCQADVTFATTNNPYLPWDYIADLLNNYPDNWLDRYVFCEWNDFEGLIYPEWRDEVHLVEPFEIPYWWNRIIGMDHGQRNPTSIGWYAISPDGDIYRYDGHYEARQWVDYHVARLQAKCDENGTDIDEVLAWPADPSIFSKSHEIPISEVYEDHEIYWERANNDVHGGMARVHEYLKLDEGLLSPGFPKGRPKFFVFNIPENEPFVEEIKNYTWKDAKLGENDRERPDKNNDHAMDEFRYVVNRVEDSEDPILASERYARRQKLEQGTTFMSQ